MNRTEKILHHLLFFKFTVGAFSTAAQVCLMNLLFVCLFVCLTNQYKDTNNSNIGSAISTQQQ